MFFKIMMNMDDEEVADALVEMKKWVGQMNSGGAVASALHPPEPDVTQPTPAGGMPVPGAGAGGENDTKLGNFPNGGDPYQQAKAGGKGALGKGLTSPLKPGVQAAPSLKSPKPVKKGGGTPSLKKATKTASVQQNADLGYSTVDTNVPKARGVYSKDPALNEAYMAGARAKRTGGTDNVPTQFCRNVHQRIAFKRGWRSTTRNRMT
jgi:hypothetical protein